MSPQAPASATRRGLLALAPCALVAPLFTACSTAAPRRDPEFAAWAEDFAAQTVRTMPHWATQSQYFGSGPEQDAMDRALRPTDVGPRAVAAPLMRQGREVLADLDLRRLDPVQRIEASTIAWAVQRNLDSLPFEDHRFVFDQFGGLQVSYQRLLTGTHPMRGPADVDSWLARLALVGPRMDDGLRRAQAAAARGLLPPRFIAERALAQLTAFAARSPAQNELVLSLAQRSEQMPGLDPAARKAALAEAERLVATSVLPAFVRVRDWVTALVPQCGDDAGLWRLPDGDAAYAQALAEFTTTPMSASEVHELGRAEVARIEAEMDRALRGLGRSAGTVSERYRALQDEVQPPAQPDPRPALLARYTAAVRDAEQRARPLFNLMPRAPVEVRREPALTETTAAAHYSSPAPDGSRPGVFWVPLPGPRFNVLGMRSLSVHEAVPGHHFQIALLQEQAGLPRWRRHHVFDGGSAYTEGWALYAERLAIEQGWYADDPQALLGALDSLRFRARRLVVDTGLHALRWTRQQAIDFGISAQEVERYVAMPGQACSYMVGMLRIAALREEARAAMGARFSLPAFHDAVLSTGSVPLDVLGDVVRAATAAP